MHINGREGMTLLSSLFLGISWLKKETEKRKNQREEIKKEIYKERKRDNIRFNR